MRVQEGISPEIAARRVSERRGEERDDRRGRVAVRQEWERANRVRASALSCGPRWPDGASAGRVRRKMEARGRSGWLERRCWAGAEKWAAAVCWAEVKSGAG